MTDPITTRPVEPIGTRVSPAFVDGADGGCLMYVDAPTYPPPSWSLRDHRRKLGLTLREAARLLGVAASVVSGLELGSLEPVEGWEAVRARMGAGGAQ